MLLLKSNNGHLKNGKLLNYFVAILSRKEQTFKIMGFRPG
jgi:hypothetical protein